MWATVRSAIAQSQLCLVVDLIGRQVAFSGRLASKGLNEILSMTGLRFSLTGCRLELQTNPQWRRNYTDLVRM
jgi:hypothetical protein